ncbi:MAG: hypothetical protein KTR31_35510 [Myxococcales bacterium]|nr:hypothetical protein [Myxococcales bacterium]
MTGGAGGPQHQLVFATAKQGNFLQLTGFVDGGILEGDLTPWSDHYEDAVLTCELDRL